MRLVGTDRTLERGPVNVYLGADGMAYVTAIGAPLDVSGVPMGLRAAPCGIEAAAASHCKDHRFHGRLGQGSLDFKPIKRRCKK